MEKSTHKICFLFAIIVALVALPIAVDLSSKSFVIQSAHAKGGNGGGNGGGQNAAGSSHGETTASSGNGHDKGRGLGHSHHAEAFEATQETTPSLSASKLGRLNAAHASAIARQNAASHSAVGMIAAYEEAVQNTLAAEEAYNLNEITLEEYAETYQEMMDTLDVAANKDVDMEVAQAVNGLLGIETPANPGDAETE